MGKIPFVTDSERGRIPVNWYPAKDDELGVIMWGSPGLELLTTVSFGPIREMKVIDGLLWVVSGASVYYVTSGLTAILAGTINTYAGRVFMESNGLELCIADSVGGYIFNLSTKVKTSITGDGFPASPGGLTYQDNYFIASTKDTQKFNISGLSDGLTWDALDFSSAEGLPDKIIAILSDHRELWLFGEESTEPYYDSGVADAPFERISGAFIEMGCAAQFSPAKVDNSVMWLSNHGQAVIAEGYQPRVVSTRKLERTWKSFNWSSAEAFSYNFEGHWFYQITFPDDDKTYVFDAATKLWHERAEGEEPYLHRHPASCYVKFNGKHLMGSYRDGNIFELKSDVYTDNGVTITRILESPVIMSDGKNQFFSSIQLDFDHGKADETGQGSDPQAMLRWSDDGGKIWSNEHWKSMGKIGEYGLRSIWRRLGSSRNRQYRVTITDPVCATIRGANVDMVVGR